MNSDGLKTLQNKIVADILDQLTFTLPTNQVNWAEASESLSSTEDSISLNAAQDEQSDSSSKDQSLKQTEESQKHPTQSTDNWVDETSLSGKRYEHMLLNGQKQALVDAEKNQEQTQNTLNEIDQLLPHEITKNSATLNNAFAAPVICTDFNETMLKESDGDLEEESDNRNSSQEHDNEENENSSDENNTYSLKEIRQKGVSVFAKS